MCVAAAELEWIDDGESYRSKWCAGPCGLGLRSRATEKFGSLDLWIYLILLTPVLQCASFPFDNGSQTITIRLGEYR